MALTKAILQERLLGYLASYYSELPIINLTRKEQLPLPWVDRLFTQEQVAEAAEPVPIYGTTQFMNATDDSTPNKPVIQKDEIKFDFTALTGYRIDDYFYTPGSYQGQPVWFKYRCCWHKYDSELLILEALKPFFQVNTLGLHVVELDPSQRSEIDGVCVAERRYLISPYLKPSLLASAAWDGLELSPNQKKRDLSAMELIEQKRLIQQAQALIIFKALFGCKVNSLKRLYHYNGYIYAELSGTSPTAKSMAQVTMGGLFNEVSFQARLDQMIGYRTVPEVALLVEKVIRKHNEEFLWLRNLLLRALSNRM